MDAQERRALLDRARAEVGLEPTADVDARDHFAALQRTRVTPGGGVPFCAAEGCNSIPARFGVPYEPDARCWWCGEHVDQAAPGDMEPRGSGLRLSPAGVPVPDDPDDDARERERADREAERRTEQQRERAVDAAELRRSREARDAAAHSELPPHLRSQPQQAAP